MSLRNDFLNRSKDCKKKKAGTYVILQYIQVPDTAVYFDEVYISFLECIHQLACLSLGLHINWKFFRKFFINLLEENPPVEKLGIRTHVHDLTAEIRDCVYLDVQTFCSHYGQNHRTNIKLLLQKSREDQDTRMRGRTVIHVPLGRTINNDYKFQTQLINWWVHYNLN